MAPTKANPGATSKRLATRPSGMMRGSPHLAPSLKPAQYDGAVATTQTTSSTTAAGGNIEKINDI